MNSSKIYGYNFDDSVLPLIKENQKYKILKPKILFKDSKSKS